jgi:hypothetical protein
LTQIGNWKNRARGNPKKGGLIAFGNKLKLNNPDYQEENN